MLAPAPPTVTAPGQAAAAAFVRRLVGGDAEALGALYDLHGATAYALARRVVRDPGLAEDVVHDAFLDAWRCASAYDAARGSVRTWLLTIVHRRAVDAVRRRRDCTEFVDDRHAVEDDSVDVVAAARVRAALGSLSQPERTVVVRAYYEGLTQSEIARELDVPLGTVKSRTFAALDKLSVLLAADELRFAGAA